MKFRDHTIVFVAVIIHQALGAVWYSAGVMGMRWLAAQGKTLEQIDPTNKTPFLISIISSFVYCYFLRWLISKLNVSHWAQGARLGTYIALCFVVTTTATHYAFLGHSFDLAWIDSGHSIMMGFLSGVILSRR